MVLYTNLVGIFIKYTYQMTLSFVYIYVFGVTGVPNELFIKVPDFGGENMWG